MSKKKEKLAPELQETGEETLEKGRGGPEEAEGPAPGDGEPEELPSSGAGDGEAPEEEAASPPGEDKDTAARLADVQDRFLRLAAEFDNYRRRTQKEKEAIYTDAKIDAAKALLPVYDNLERAVKQETADEAYKKGVEMTMAGLKKAFADFGIAEIDAAGQPFDPRMHNAVMHVEDDSLGENTVAEVFQAGFMLGEKVIRFAMVKVAN